MVHVCRRGAVFVVATNPAVNEVESTTKAHGSVPPRRDADGRQQWWRSLGPGLITGVADDDPSGVATYAQAGAKFGNGMLWTVPVVLPMMVAVQEICDRTAMATGDSLGALIGRRFARTARWWIGALLIALLVANGLNIAADLAAIGEGAHLLHAGPGRLWAVLAGAGLTVAVVLGSFERIIRVFKWLCLTLVVYAVVLFTAHVSWLDVGRGLIGAQLHWSWQTVAMIVAILGTSVSPYMFFWQSGHRVEEMRSGSPRSAALSGEPRSAARRLLRNARSDTTIGMLVSSAAMFAIIAATAATVGKSGPVELGSAADAAAALEPVAGRASAVIFAVGFIAAGLIAVPVLAASAALALAALLHRQWGFSRHLGEARLFYALVALGTIGGAVLASLSANVMGLLVLSAVVNGIAGAPFLICTMLIADDRSLMGEYRNKRLGRLVGWTVTVVMAVAGVLGVYVVATGK